MKQFSFSCVVFFLLLPRVLHGIHVSKTHATFERQISPTISNQKEEVFESTSRNPWNTIIQPIVNLTHRIFSRPENNTLDDNISKLNVSLDNYERNEKKRQQRESKNRSIPPLAKQVDEASSTEEAERKILKVLGLEEDYVKQ